MSPDKPSVPESQKIEPGEEGNPSQDEQNPTESQLPITPPVVEQPTTPTNHQNTQHNQGERFSKTKLVLEIITVVGIYGYGFVAFLQWQAMQESTEQARRAADAAFSAASTADATLKSAQKSFQIEQRPYVVADVPQFQQFAPDKIVSAHITFKNVGRTAAIKQITFANLLRYRASNSRDEYFAFIENAYADLRKQDTGGGKYGALARKDVAPNATFFITKENPEILSSKDIPDVERGALNFFYTGIVKYTDSFNGRYETEFCYFYFGTDIKTWHICDSHNTIK
jgi:hypothetical protein